MDALDLKTSVLGPVGLGLRPGRAKEGQKKRPCLAILSIVCLALLTASCAKNARGRDLRHFTGAHTRVVWVQDQGGGADTFAQGHDLLLMGFDSEDRRGERPVLHQKGNYSAPVFSPDGRLVLVSDVHAFKTFLVSWDKGSMQDFSPGLVLATQRDPATGISWAYVGTTRSKGKGDTVGEIRRIRIDDPHVSECVWNQIPVASSGFRVSRSGHVASGVFPWPNGGLASLPNRSFKQLARGCWPSLAPDDSLLFWIFDGAHRNLAIHAPGGRNWRVPINTAPEVGGFEVYHPRWSNHVRYMAMTGPYTVGGGGNKIRGGGKGVEVHLGRFSDSFDGIEDWFQVTQNEKGDFYPDVWIKGGESSTVPVAVVRQVPATDVAETDRGQHARWPGNMKDLVFLWENAKSANQVRDPDSGAVLRTCKALAHGRAVYGPYFDMRLAGGIMVADDADDALLTACRHRNELTIQAVVTPGSPTQEGPAHIISFSAAPSRINVALGQEKDALVLRLRTPRTGIDGANPQVALCRVEAGKTYHVVVTYRPGELRCYLDGRDVPNTPAVTGDFSNWEPASLVFGNDPTHDRPWTGRLEGIAIYSRFMGAEEAAHVHALYAPRLTGRKSPPRLVVEARLDAMVPTPDPKDLDTYRRCLANYTYTVEKVLEGTCEDETIGVQHWVILDMKVLPVTRQIGQTYRLVLEPLDAHPELESERVMEGDDLVLSVYYDMAL